MVFYMIIWCGGDKCTYCSWIQLVYRYGMLKHNNDSLAPFGSFAKNMMNEWYDRGRFTPIFQTESQVSTKNIFFQNNLFRENNKFLLIVQVKADKKLKRTSLFWSSVKFIKKRLETSCLMKLICNINLMFTYNNEVFCQKKYKTGNNNGFCLYIVVHF